MFQTHSERGRYNFCPHVAYIQNRKDRILKKNDWSGVFDRYCVRFSKEAKISLGCHSQGCNILGSWTPNLSKGSQVPVGLWGRSLWGTTTWVGPGYVSGPERTKAGAQMMGRSGKKTQAHGENAGSTPKLHRWLLFLENDAVCLTWQMLNWIQFCLFKWWFTRIITFTFSVTI